MVFRLLSLLSLLWLTACGFEPVYGNRSQSAVSLPLIDVAPIPGREGQIYRTSLEDLLSPESKSQSTRYVLQTSLTMESAPVVVEKDGTISRYRVLLISPFTLFDITQNKIIYQNKVTRTVTYNVADEDYSTYVAEHYSVQQGIEELAHDTFHRVSSYFARNP